MESNGQAGLEPRSYVSRQSEVQTYYTEARKQGVCRRCGRGGYLRSGLHPSGRRGQPVRLVGADLDALKDWIEKAGWLCPSCASVMDRGEVKAPPPPPSSPAKPWEPYPVAWTELEDNLDKELEKMRSGSDGMGIRSPGVCAKHEANARTLWRERLGWVTVDEWFTCHEKAT